MGARFVSLKNLPLENSPVIGITVPLRCQRLSPRRLVVSVAFPAAVTLLSPSAASKPDRSPPDKRDAAGLFRPHPLLRRGTPFRKSDATEAPPAPSPWQEGELELQRHAGVAEQMDTVGRKFVRHFLLDQHREFFQVISFIAVGTVDRQGVPWATIRCGEPGFLYSPDLLFGPGR